MVSKKGRVHRVRACQRGFGVRPASRGGAAYRAVAAGRFEDVRPVYLRCHIDMWDDVVCIEVVVERRYDVGD